MTNRLHENTTATDSPSKKFRRAERIALFTATLVGLVLYEAFHFAVGADFIRSRYSKEQAETIMWQGDVIDKIFYISGKPAREFAYYIYSR